MFSLLKISTFSVLFFFFYMLYCVKKITLLYDLLLGILIKLLEITKFVNPGILLEDFVEYINIK